MKESVIFQMLPQNYLERPDGSISYRVTCPVKDCQNNYLLTYKRYQSSYVRRLGDKQNVRSSNVKPPRWNFGQIQKHLLRVHSVDSDSDKSSSDDTNESSDHDHQERIDLTDDTSESSEDHQERIDLTSSVEAGEDNSNRVSIIISRSLRFLLNVIL